jgi:hypothetical protein
MSETRLEYYHNNRERIIEKSKKMYRENREAKLAYQKEYTAKRRAAGWRPKKYPRKYVPKPRVKYVLKNPKPPRELKNPKKPKLVPEPRKPKYEFKEASFSMTLV